MLTRSGRVAALRRSAAAAQLGKTNNLSVAVDRNEIERYRFNDSYQYVDHPNNGAVAGNVVADGAVSTPVEQSVADEDGLRGMMARFEHSASGIFFETANTVGK